MSRRKPDHEDPAGLAWADHQPDKRGQHDAGREALACVNAEAGQTMNALTHGAHLARFGARPCRGCPVADRCDLHDEEGRCQVEVAFLVERRALVEDGLRKDGQDVDLAEPLVNVALDADLRLRRRQRALSVTGDFLAGLDSGYAELQPAAKDLPAAYRAVERAYEALGLTPRARRALEKKGETGPKAEFAAALAELERQDREKRAAATDAEFEEGDDESADD